MIEYHERKKLVMCAQHEGISKQLYWVKEVKWKGNTLDKSTCVQFQKMQTLLCLKAG